MSAQKNLQLESAPPKGSQQLVFWPLHKNQVFDAAQQGG